MDPVQTPPPTPSFGGTPTSAPTRSSHGALIIAIVVIILGIGGYFAYGYFNPSTKQIVNRLIETSVDSITHKDVGLDHVTATLDANLTLRPVAGSDAASEFAMALSDLGIKNVSALSVKAGVTIDELFNNGAPGAVKGSADASVVLGSAYKLGTLGFAIDNASMPKHIYVKFDVSDEITKLLPPEEAASFTLGAAMLGNSWFDIDLAKMAELSGVSYEQLFAGQNPETMKKIAPVVEKALRAAVDKELIVFTPTGVKPEHAGTKTVQLSVRVDLDKLESFFKEEGPGLIDALAAVFPEGMPPAQVEFAKKSFEDPAFHTSIVGFKTALEMFIKSSTFTLDIEPRTGIPLGYALNMAIMIPNELEIDVSVAAEIAAKNELTELAMPTDAIPLENLIGPMMMGGM